MPAIPRKHVELPASARLEGDEADVGAFVVMRVACCTSGEVGAEAGCHVGVPSVSLRANIRASHPGRSNAADTNLSSGSTQLSKGVHLCAAAS